MTLLGASGVLLLLVSATPPKLAAPGLVAVGIEEKKAAVFTDYFAQQLSQYGFQVTTASEISAMIGLERQKQLLGCSDDSSSCVAELAGALGVDGLITGNVARLEPTGFVLTVKVVRAGDGSSMGSYSGRVPDESGALDWLSSTAMQFAKSQGLFKESEGLHLRSKAWIPAAAGAVAAGAGVVLFAQTKSFAAELERGEGPGPSQLDAEIAGARTRETTGVVLMGVGGAALATAVVFFLTGSEAESAPAVSFFVTPNGGALSAAWSIP